MHQSYKQLPTILKKTQTTPELCAGIVKAQKLHEKNPAQHASDLEMLEEKQEVQAALKHQLTGQAKAIDCIHVDGAVDEGPAHHEVQFWWTLRHLRRRKVCTLLTSRSSGSSYLNRVELQNGSLSRGHANTFIPSTLTGACTDEQTGKVDESKWKRNMELAIQAYINQVNHCPCGDTVIHLFQGANSEELQSVREKLQIFLKGSQKMKHNLQDEFPDLYAWFDSIWTVRNRHMVPGLPSQYIFLLICCYKENCTHPLCKKGSQIQYTLGILEDPPFVTCHCLVQTWIGFGAIPLVLHAKGFVQDTTSVQYSLTLPTVLL